VEEVILPALDEGKVVITDRFSLSTLAYQCHGRGLSKEVFEEVSRWILGDLRPSITFLLDLPVDEVSGRIRGRRDRMEREDKGFFGRVREGFLKEARNGPNVMVLSASVPPKEIHRQVVETLNRLLLKFIG